VAPTTQDHGLTRAFVFQYTSDNLGGKGIHEVVARKFCLVAADHPLVSAVSLAIVDTPEHTTRLARADSTLSRLQISENADKLQMGEISMMR
jgi:chorismate-pyruvate lyase